VGAMKEKKRMWWKSIYRRGVLVNERGSTNYLI